MGHYKVLSTPVSDAALTNYKGLYRCEPFPQSNANSRLISLWERYTQYLEPLTNMGITTELTLDELKDFAGLAAKDAGVSHEVIFFSETFECPHPTDYYGIDVTGLGGYSMIGENFFTGSKEIENGIYHLYDVLNKHFRGKLNANGLFDMLEDAVSFRAVIKDLTELSPGCIEQEDWSIFHIFKIT